MKIAGGNMPTKSDLDIVFQKLKTILDPYAAKLIVSGDGENGFNLDTSHVMKNKQRLYFAGVRMGKAYISFYLMPVYCCPEMSAAVSPALKKRMQGKSCFNFKEVDEKLFKELAKLTKAGYAKFNDKKFVANLLK